MISLRVDDNMLTIIDELSEILGKSRSTVIRQCVLFVYLYLAKGLTLVELLKPLPEVMEYIEDKTT